MCEELEALVLAILGGIVGASMQCVFSSSCMSLCRNSCGARAEAETRPPAQEDAAPTGPELV